MLRHKAASILESEVEPARLRRPVPRKRRRKMRHDEILVLDAMLLLMIMVILALVLIPKFILHLFQV